mgnify:CR=1 FL=1|jgi:hypothetical protein
MLTAQIEVARNYLVIVKPHKTLLKHIHGLHHENYFAK